MPGLPDHRREALRRLVREARRRTEGAFEDRLRVFGLWAECSKRHGHSRGCYVIPGDQLTLPLEAHGMRAALEAAIEREEVGFPGLLPSERARRSVARFIRGAAFTLLNRLAALRAMEARSLVDETVVRRARYGGRSLREYRVAQAHPELGPDQALERALREGFREAGTEIGVLFDLEDPYGLLLPDPRSLRELLRVFGEDITEADWRADDILGWIYQYYQDEARESFRTGRGRGQRRAADADGMAAINCLYTPHWVVRALVDNSLGRLLLEQQGRLEAAQEHRWSEEELRTAAGDTVAEFCRYLVPPTGSARPRPVKPLREIRVLDPACGSGHFLIYAFDVLWRAYREAEPDASPDEHAATILERNLFGLDIDLRACELAALGLYLKAKEYAPAFRPRALNIVCADARILDGQRRKSFLSRLGDDHALKRVAERLLRDLQYTAEIGSLLRVREPFEALFRARRQREPGQGRLVDIGPEQLRLEGVIPRERTIAEILGAIRTFEREAVERADMGGQLFAADAERSLGVLSLLSQRYDVVLMNPPYNKRAELPGALREYLASHYRSRADVYLAFIEQAVNLLQPRGILGMLTPRSYMFARSGEPLRTEVLGETVVPRVVMEFGRGLPDDATVRTAAAVLHSGISGDVMSMRGSFWDLTDPTYPVASRKETGFVDALLALREGRQPDVYHEVSLDQIAWMPGRVWTYWASRELARLFLNFPPLDRDNARRPKERKVAEVRQGLGTMDNLRFLRYWWEVQPGLIGQGRRWVPFAKGPEYLRWFHDPILVVLWENDGRDIRRYIVDRYPYLKGKPQWLVRSCVCCDTQYAL